VRVLERKDGMMQTNANQNLQITTKQTGNMDIEKLKRIQMELAKRIVLEDSVNIEDVKYVIGVDQSFLPDERVISACTLLTFPSLELVKSSVKVDKVNFPYIPTFLMFREGDPAVNAVRDVVDDLGEDKNKTIIVVDGSGIAHPRRCGLASYIALKLNMPSIGVTKRKLYGEVVEPKREMQSTPIYDGEEIIGYALKSCKRCKPIYISPGSYISPRTALSFAKMCIKKYKLPEPIRLAHNLATKTKLEMG
jgi:deoxyribonuclease V